MYMYLSMLYIGVYIYMCIFIYTDILELRLLRFRLFHKVAETRGYQRLRPQVRQAHSQYSTQPAVYIYSEVILFYKSYVWAYIEYSTVTLYLDSIVAFKPHSAVQCLLFLLFTC